MYCPYLEYCSGGLFTTSSDRYICKVTGVEMPYDSTKVKYLCNAESRYEYEKCPIYQDKR